LLPDGSLFAACLSQILDYKGALFGEEQHIIIDPEGKMHEFSLSLFRKFKAIFVYPENH